MTTADASVAVATPHEKPHVYGFSVLISAIGRFFRGILAFLPIIIVNAIVQAFLISAFNPQPGLTVSFVVSVIISFLVLLASFFYLNVTALHVATGKARFSQVFGRSGGAWGLFALWAIIMYVVVLAGLIINTWVGLLVLVLLPFVTLAAADGKKNAIGTNFKVIAGRPVRYVITALILGIILVICTLLASVNGFFIGGWQASFIAWIGWGLLASWYLSALALIYRSTLAGAVEADEPAPAPAQAAAAA